MFHTPVLESEGIVGVRRETSTEKQDLVGQEKQQKLHTENMLK